MDNHCKNIQDQLAGYILGILDAEDCEKIDEHVNRCQQCRQYKRVLEDENRVLLQFGEEIKETLTVRQDKVIEALNTLARISHKRNFSQWRRIIGSRKMKLTAAAVIIVAVMAVSVSVLDMATPAYAVEQTIDAIKKVKTVHMAGEFYGRGEFECWLRFAGDPDVPTHMWLFLPRIHLAKICSPDGLFHFNKRTNYVFFTVSDHRGRTWVLKFGSFFKDTVQGTIGVAGASRIDSVDIYNEKAFIVVHVTTPEREQKFLVDPETKLPIRFSTIREDAPKEMAMRSAFTVKNIEWIRYNQEPPGGIFDMPAHAKIVQDGFDCWVDPDAGLTADGMTRQQACLAIVKQTGQALIDLDIDTLCKLDLFFLACPPEIWEQLRQMKESGQWVDAYVVAGDVYEEGDFWYVPCEIHMSDGKSEFQTAMIKFYEMEGKTICVIVGSKEKGVVD